MMEVTRFTVGRHKGYRFEDAKGRGCSVHQQPNYITVGVNISGGNIRMVLDRERALWLVQVLLNYVETGEL